MYNGGIKNNMLKWFQNFLGQRFCATIFNNCFSKYRQKYKGLSQGSIISPAFFDIMINDCLKILRMLNVYYYMAMIS